MRAASCPKAPGGPGCYRRGLRNLHGHLAGAGAHRRVRLPYPRGVRAVRCGEALPGRRWSLRGIRRAAAAATCCAASWRRTNARCSERSALRRTRSVLAWFPAKAAARHTTGTTSPATVRAGATRARPSCRKNDTDLVTFSLKLCRFGGRMVPTGPRYQVSRRDTSQRAHRVPRREAARHGTRSEQEVGVYEWSF